MKDSQLERAILLARGSVWWFLRSLDDGAPLDFHEDALRRNLREVRLRLGRSEAP